MSEKQKPKQKRMTGSDIYQDGFSHGVNVTADEFAEWAEQSLSEVEMNPIQRSALYHEIEMHARERKGGKL